MNILLGDLAHKLVGKFVGKPGILRKCQKIENPQSLSFQWIADLVGTPSGVRTLDTLIKSQVLCQLS